MISLRDYQEDGIAQIRAHLLQGRRSVLYVAPTGSGKTSLTAYMIANAIARGKRAWFCVHRRELVRQSVETLENSAAVNVGIIGAGFGANSYHPAQVASIQSLLRRWKRYELPDLLIVDEAHHIASKSWAGLLRSLLAAKPSIKVIGLTATPERLDGRGLGQYFQAMVQGPSTYALIEQGHLAPYKLFAPSRPDLTGVHTVAGDYNRKELDAAMSSSRVVGDAIAEYQQKCPGKRALMFLWSVRASEEMAINFNAVGISAAHIDGTTNERVRDRYISEFRQGSIKVLTNCEIVTEGFDVPAIEACFLLRPTQSLALYCQMVGRALRPYPGKEFALLMDHSGLAFRHGLPDEIRDWTLDGEDRKPRDPQEIPIRQCMKCFAVLPVQARSCKYCGFVFVVTPREVDQQSGELRELGKDEIAHLKRVRIDERRQAQTYDALLRIEQRLGYKRGWAKHVFEARQRKEG